MNTIIAFIFGCIFSYGVGFSDRHVIPDRTALHSYRQHMYPLGIFTPILRVLYIVPFGGAFLALILPLHAVFLIIWGVYFYIAHHDINKSYPLILSLHNEIVEAPDNTQHRYFVHAALQ